MKTNMYTISLRKEFISQHFLQHEEGPEKTEHPHNYLLEVLISGKELDENGYLVDLNEIETILQDILNDFRDKKLNDLSEFEKKSPTLENFAKVIWDKLVNKLNSHKPHSIEVKLWENKDAYASYKKKISM